MNLQTLLKLKLQFKLLALKQKSSTNIKFAYNQNITKRFQLKKGKNN